MLSGAWGAGDFLQEIAESAEKGGYSNYLDLLGYPPNFVGMHLPR